MEFFFEHTLTSPVTKLTGCRSYTLERVTYHACTDQWKRGMKMNNTLMFPFKSFLIYTLMVKSSYIVIENTRFAY